MIYYILALSLLLISCGLWNVEVTQNDIGWSWVTIFEKLSSSKVFSEWEVMLKNSAPEISNLETYSWSASWVILNNFDLTGLQLNPTDSYDPSYFVSKEYDSIRGMSITVDNSHQLFRITSHDSNTQSGQMTLLDWAEWTIPGNHTTVTLLDNGTPFLISDSNYFNTVNVDWRANFETKKEGTSWYFIEKMDFLAKRNERVTALFSSISDQKYTKNLDAYYIWNLTNQSIFGKFSERVSILYKNKENLSHKAWVGFSAIMSYSLNDAWLLWAYIGEIIDLNIPSEIWKYQYWDWCFNNFDMILKKYSHIWLWRNSRQYLWMNNKIYDWYPIYWLIGNLKNKPVWVWCDFNTHYARLYLWEKLIDWSSRIVEDPAIIGNYIVYKSRDLDIPREVYTFLDVKRKSEDYFVIVDLNNLKKYKLFSTKDWYAVTDIMYSEGLKNYFIFKERNLLTKQERVISITPEKLIQLGEIE